MCVVQLSERSYAMATDSWPLPAVPRSFLPSPRAEVSILPLPGSSPRCAFIPRGHLSPASLTPMIHGEQQKYRAMTGWVVGWLNLLGQVAGVASTEWGLSKMILSAVVIGQPSFVITAGKQFGLYAGLLVFHGSLNSLKTRDLAFFTKFFVFINIGATFLIIILLLALTPRDEMNSAKYTFTSTINDTGYNSGALAFLFGLRTSTSSILPVASPRY